ncbi:hypothetical protein [Methylobacterium sp. P5_C11]
MLLPLGNFETGAVKGCRPGPDENLLGLRHRGADVGDALSFRPDDDGLHPGIGRTHAAILSEDRTGGQTV